MIRMAKILPAVFEGGCGILLVVVMPELQAIWQGVSSGEHGCDYTMREV